MNPLILQAISGFGPLFAIYLCHRHGLRYDLRQWRARRR